MEAVDKIVSRRKKCSSTIRLSSYVRRSTARFIFESASSGDQYTPVAFNEVFQAFPDPADYRPIVCLNTVAQGSKPFKTMFEKLNEPMADRL